MSENYTDFDITIKGSKAIDFFNSERYSEIIERIQDDDDYGVEYDEDGENIITFYGTIEGGNLLDAFMPDSLEEAISLLNDNFYLEMSPEDQQALMDSIERLSWKAGVTGLEIDDGRFDSANYDPVMLQKYKKSIAETNQCALDEVTDDMFKEFVHQRSLDPDDPFIEYSFIYDKEKNQIEIYQTDGMHEREETKNISLPNELVLNDEAKLIKKNIGEFV